MTEDLFEKRLNELAMRASKRGEATFTHFMDLNQIHIATRIAESRRINLLLDGGYPDAERRMGAFYETEPPEEAMWPIQPVEITWRSQFGTPQHRDFLGALMALGFERERMGDIVLCGERAYVFVEPEMAEYIVKSLDSVGRIAIKCSVVSEVASIPPPAGRIVRSTVSSLRLDALVAVGFSISRSDAAERIARGKVAVNQAPVLRPDAAVQTGSIVSSRGDGRFRLESVDGETRKGRLAIKIFKYGVS